MEHHTGLIYDTNLWLAFSFAIFCFIAWKMAGSLIIGALDKRADDIKKDIAEAETLRTEAQQFLAQYQRKQRDAQKEADRLLENAKNNAYQIRKNTEKEIKENLELKERNLKDRIERMKQQAIAEIKAEAAQLSIDATKRIIAEQANKKTANDMVDNSVKAIKSLK